MKQFRTLAGCTALVGLLAAAPASADVTPEQVWQRWQTFGASTGQTLTARSQSRSGDTLKLSDVTVRFEQEGMTAEGTVPEVNLTGKSDGTVEVTLSPEFPMTVTMTPPPEEGQPEPRPTTLVLSIRQPGALGIAGGEGDLSTLEVRAPTAAIALVSVDGQPASPETAAGEATLSDVVAHYRSEGPESITNDLTAAVAEVSIQATSPENKARVDIRASATDLKATSSGRISAGADMAAALRAGANSTGNVTFGPMTVEFDIQEPETETSGGTAAANPARMKGSASAASGWLNAGASDDGLLYGGGSKTVSFTVSGTRLPVPQINASYAEGSFDLMMPIVKSESPRDFRLVQKLVDLKISDEVWQLFDPQGQLPRDPATLIVDTKGAATLDVDLFDQQQMAQLGDRTPFRLNALDVDQLLLKIAGAEISGHGGFTFDNSDLTTFQGLPVPTGKLNLRAVGLNGLIDKLVAMGLVPNDQALSARVMLGMFGRAVEGATDTLTSELEFRDKGFFANGQRLQ